MVNNSTYTPVSCDVHSQFELLIMHNSRINIKWQDDTGLQYESIVSPKDIQTKAGEEFLIVINGNNEERRIRLDRIQSFKEVNS